MSKVFTKRLVGLLLFLLHDARGNVNSATAVGIALPLLVEEGYEFVTLGKGRVFLER